MVELKMVKSNLDLKIVNKILEILEIDYVEFFTSIKKNIKNR